MRSCTYDNSVDKIKVADGGARNRPVMFPGNTLENVLNLYCDQCLRKHKYGMDLRFIEQIDVSSRFTPAFIVVQTFTGEWEAMLTDLRFEKKLRIRRWTMIYRLGIKLRIPVDAGEIVALPGKRRISTWKRNKKILLATIMTRYFLLLLSQSVAASTAADNGAANSTGSGIRRARDQNVLIETLEIHTHMHARTVERS
ncbi:hypothetical protein V1477_003967 [Vespula maculifrons]|uniref:Uncharacterized protein n=1 Tax=Vespula maculifrons TaxID=7453 RepID=A0ABD2CSL0_VESMC